MTSPAVLEHSRRRVPLDGPVNFRDLGGYGTGGGQAVRWRKVYRADGLESMTERDALTVRHGLGVGTVIDLRTEREIELIGVGPMGDVDRHHFSIIDETQEAWHRALDEGDIVTQYLVMLDSSGPKFVDALRVIAAADHAVVFHCAAGKDRTGLLAALLLSVLGVDRQQISHDYGLTTAVLPALRERYLQRTYRPEFRARYDADPGLRDRTADSMSADPATVDRVLERVEQDHGTAEGWLRGHGLSAAVVDDLRARLLA